MDTVGVGSDWISVDELMVNLVINAPAITEGVSEYDIIVAYTINSNYTVNLYGKITLTTCQVENCAK